MDNNTMTGLYLTVAVLFLLTKFGRYAAFQATMLTVGAAYQGAKLSFRALVGGSKGAYRASRGMPLADPVKVAVKPSVFVTEEDDIKPAAIVQRSIGTRARVDFWFYDDHVMRVIKFHTGSLKRKHGARFIRLPQLQMDGTNQDEVISKTMKEASAIVMESEAPGSQAKVVLTTQPKAVAVKEEVKSEKTVPEKLPEAQATWSGFLEKHGHETTTYRGQPTERYGILIKDVEQSGLPVQIYGADLERALRESGAACGDLIKVNLIGDTEVGKNKNRKKIYSIQKL